jgi:hypothetical protein
MATSSGSRFAQQFPIRENQQTYTHPYTGQDFDAGMGAGSVQMPYVGVRGGCYHQGVQTLPFASAGGINKGGAYYSLMPQPTVADFAPVQQYAWTDWKRYEGNDTAFSYVDKSYAPPPDQSYMANSNYMPKGDGMGGSFYLVVDNNQGRNVVPI